MTLPSDSKFLRSQGFLLGDKINSGSFSIIHCALRIIDAEVVAVKMMDLRSSSSCFRQRFLPRELANIRRLDHPNIIKVLKIAKSETKVYIIMEFAVTNLRRQLDQRVYIPEDQARKWFRQLASALYYLYKRGVAHRDIKIENILIDTKGDIKLCDFGFSKLIEGDEGNKQANSTTFCGSLGYCAPEILHRTPYNPWKTDVWSLGVVLYKMVVGGMPFGEGNDLGSVRRITKAQTKVVEFPTFPKTSAECQELIKSLLTVESDRRITLLDISRSKWINAKVADKRTNKFTASTVLPKATELRNITVPTASPFDSVVNEATKPALATPSVISRLRMRLPSLTLRTKK